MVDEKDNNIEKFIVPPRVEKGKLGKHTWEVRYNPENEHYEWEALVMQSYRLVGHHTTLELAIADAKKQIKRFINDNDMEE